MRRLAPLILVLVGCAGTPPPAAPPRTVLSPTPPPDLPMEVARACVDAASTEPFAQFMAPGGSSGFRAHVARRVADVGCCFTSERREVIRGDASLRVLFEPVADDPAEGAAARLLAPIDPGRPVEEACLRGVVEAWRMPHAPVSDVVRVPLDPRVSHRSDGASMQLSYPL